MRAAARPGLVRLAWLIALGATLSGCAGLQGAAADPDFLLCEQARAQALRGDTAGAEATIGRIRDLRQAWYCKNYLLEIDRGLHPEGT